MAVKRFDGVQAMREDIGGLFVHETDYDALAAEAKRDYAALEARCREREEYAAKLEQRTDKSLTEHAAGCIADQERIAQLEVIARDVYNGFKKEAWEGANEYFNEHPEVTKHYGSPKETEVKP